MVLVRIRGGLTFFEIRGVISHRSACEHSLNPPGCQLDHRPHPKYLPTWSCRGIRCLCRPIAAWWPRRFQNVWSNTSIGEGAKHWFRCTAPERLACGSPYRWAEWPKVFHPVEFATWPSRDPVDVYSMQLERVAKDAWFNGESANCVWKLLTSSTGQSSKVPTGEPFRFHCHLVPSYCRVKLKWSMGSHDFVYYVQWRSIPVNLGGKYGLIL